jgi:hypothetical protein
MSGFMDWFDLVLIGLSIGVAVGGTAMIKLFGSDLAARTVWSVLPPHRYTHALRAMHISILIAASLALHVAPFFRKR